MTDTPDVIDVKDHPDRNMPDTGHEQGTVLNPTETQADNGLMRHQEYLPQKLKDWSGSFK